VTFDEINELGGYPDYPRKLLDKKAFVRIDPDSGEPQLIRVEPHFSEEKALQLETVLVTIDDGPQIIMEREIAQQVFSEGNGCVPLEEFSDWKRKSAS